jgi:RNA polymerase sigma-70 factor (ECF subfamily)
LLADVEGLKYSEIAQAIDVPVGTVRSRLARARSELQRALWKVAQEHGLLPGGEGS